jgi:GTP-dependent phosphoenolpyruvate carboxykinase
MDPDSASVWWAGKELIRDKKLSDHVGRNDKTKVIMRTHTNRTFGSLSLI